jgi:hypothetical protein
LLKVLFLALVNQGGWRFAAAVTFAFQVGRSTRRAPPWAMRAAAIGA